MRQSEPFNGVRCGDEPNGKMRKESYGYCLKPGRGAVVIKDGVKESNSDQHVVVRKIRQRKCTTRKHRKAIVRLLGQFLMWLFRMNYLYSRTIVGGWVV